MIHVWPLSHRCQWECHSVTAIAALLCTDAIQLLCCCALMLYSCRCRATAYAGVPCSITAAAAAVGAAVSWTATARRCHAVHRCHRAHRTACQSMCVPRCSSMRLSEPCPSMSCSPASPCQPCPAVVVQSCFAGWLVVGISSHHGRMSLRMVFDDRMLGGNLRLRPNSRALFFIFT